MITNYYQVVLIILQINDQGLLSKIYHSSFVIKTKLPLQPQ